jgi:hypothetical protein
MRIGGVHRRQVIERHHGGHVPADGLSAHAPEVAQGTHKPAGTWSGGDGETGSGRGARPRSPLREGDHLSQPLG